MRLIDKASYDVAPHVGAWIETFTDCMTAFAAWSLPMWERGLKPMETALQATLSVSLPMWERGLKPKKDNGYD